MNNMETRGPLVYFLIGLAAVVLFALAASTYAFDGDVSMSWVNGDIYGHADADMMVAGEIGHKVSAFRPYAAVLARADTTDQLGAFYLTEGLLTAGLELAITDHVYGRGWQSWERNIDHRDETSSAQGITLGYRWGK